MITYALKRVGFAFVMLILVLTCVFILVRIVPGDPALAIVGEQASKSATDAVRTRLGLDQPIFRLHHPDPERRLRQLDDY